ncbi:HK97-gp10 family putative phage morphogenesis protein [Paremcibacter congregatus]|uniref:HK97 gp10 family phage protein n=1 Tax=Paremcibacter congregatus TaxID=2043170 RepID=A0A2G4YTW3_9PROT|nr:HK97-gp10 family putative phage morphogenesis protein [Paremcibacter congregatus]PHZ84896.1 hypothetical protein CRD36_09220 [Paremcibacter congregatus]QDE26130.1 hypothetical protein FIV45_01925 [Paremcibacter congregatus]
MTVEKLSRDLDQQARLYERRLAEMVDQLAAAVVRGARARVLRNLKHPKDHSDLAASLRVEKDPAGDLRVITDLPYARYLEFGTRYQAARPFLTPAVEEVKVAFAGLRHRSQQE